MSWFTYLSVVGVSMFKFVFGPVSGMAMGLLWYESLLCTVLGMMTTVSGMTFLNSFFRRLKARFYPTHKKKSPFTKRNRWAIKVRQRLGMWGVAFLTPILFTPPIGVILALAFRYPRTEIFYKMFISATIWGLLMVYFFYYLKELFA